MKKYDCVVVVGCSFLAGSNINKSDGKHDRTKRMSFLLAEELNCKEINLGRPGGSNERIFRKVHEWVENNTRYKQPLFIIGLTGITRTQIYSNASEYFWEIHPFDWDDNNVSQIKKRSKKWLGEENKYKELDTWIKLFRRYFWNEDVEVTKLERNCLFLDSYLKQRNIDYLLFNATEDNIPNIKDRLNYMAFNLPENSIKVKRNDNHFYNLFHKKEESWRIDDCWYHYLHNRHVNEYGNFDPINRPSIPPHGKYFCGGHPSFLSNKELTQMLLNQLK